MIMLYDHRYAHPESPYRRFIQQDNEAQNRPFLEHVRALQDARQEAQEAALGQKRLKKSAQQAIEKSQVEQAKHARSQKPRSEAYLNYLDPVPLDVTEGAHPSAYDRLPRILGINIRMIMPQAVSHSKRVLLNGMLALNLITGQQAQIMRASKGDSRLKVRKGMPIGVEVALTDPRVFLNFMDKWTEIVLPRLRDFRGFSKSSGPEGRTDMSRRCVEMGRTFTRSTLPSFSDSILPPPTTTTHTQQYGQDVMGGTRITVPMTAETWQAFPEIEAAYLKFPSQGSMGALQDFQVEFVTSARSDEDARLLLSGYRVPFTYLEPVPAREESDVEHDDSGVQDV